MIGSDFDERDRLINQTLIKGILSVVKAGSYYLRGAKSNFDKFNMLYAPFLADRLWSNVNFIFM